MRYRFIRSAVLAGGLSATLATALTASAAAAPDVGGPGPAGTAAAGPAARTALLINGDTITGPGAGAGAVRPAGTALASTLVSLTFGGTSYEVPVDALPFLGRSLDPALFNVTTLLRAEAGGRLPLRVTYHGRLPALSGLTITRRGGGTADGYLTAKSARAFGAALARQYLADHGHGHGGRMFSDGVSVSLGGARPVPTPARPRFVMHTLTVAGTDLAGRPDTGDPVYLVNVDDSSITGDLTEPGSVFYHGAARFSVPAGHYFALADFVHLSARGALTAERVVTLPQFTVSGNATVHMSERAADSKVTIVTPRPAVTEATEWQVARVPRTGFPEAFGFMDMAPVAIWVSPSSRRVTTGGLRTFLDAWLTSPPAAARPYEYDLAWPGPAGVVPAGRHVAHPASLATVDSRYYSPVPRRAFLLRTGRTLFQINSTTPPIQAIHLLEPLTPLRLPEDRTEYTTASPSLEWNTAVVSSVEPPFSLNLADASRAYHPGERVTEDWNNAPLHPGVAVSLLGRSDFFPTLPSASRVGDALWLDVTPFSDSTPGHLGSGAAVRGTYQINQNGVRIAGGSADQGDGLFATGATLSSKPSTVAFALDVSRAGAPVSARSRTVWTWRSARQPGVTLPAGWVCPDGSQDCDVESMMTLRYHVAGLALDDTARSGPQALEVSVGHLQLASSARITSARVQVSFDGGTAWQAAAVTGRNGSYRVRYVAPATARYVTLRVTAADAIGGQVTQTITRAYKIAS